MLKKFQNSNFLELIVVAKILLRSIGKFSLLKSNIALRKFLVLKAIYKLHHDDSSRSNSVVILMIIMGFVQSHKKKINIQGQNTALPPVRNKSYGKSKRVFPLHVYHEY